MKLIKEHLHVITALLVFLSMKTMYMYASSDDLIFLLRPTDYLICLFTGNQSNYIAGHGYFHSDLNILIEKSCAGFNFFILFFLIIYLTCIQHFKNATHRWYLLPTSLITCYLLTIAVNVSRIITAISIKAKLNFIDFNSSHQLQGTFIYLFFLVLFYLTLKYFLQKTTSKNEKPA